MSLMVCPSTPAAPAFAFTSRRLVGKCAWDPLPPAPLGVAAGLPAHAGCPGARLPLPLRPAQDALAAPLVDERMEPPRGTRLRGPIECSLEFSRLVPGVV